MHSPSHIIENTNDGVLQTYVINGINQDVLRTAEVMFQMLRTENQSRYEHNGRTPMIRVLCNGNETYCNSARDLVELCQGSNISPEESIRAMMGYWASGCCKIILNTKY